MHKNQTESSKMGLLVPHGGKDQVNQVTAEHPSSEVCLSRRWRRRRLNRSWVHRLLRASREDWPMESPQPLGHSQSRALLRSPGLCQRKGRRGGFRLGALPPTHVA